MVSTTWLDHLAALDAPRRRPRPPADWPARALSAFCLTVEVSSSIEAAVSSSELACSSVREDRSWLPAAIWPEAVAMVSVPWRTSPTTLARLAFMSFSACISWPVSSFESRFDARVRSPRGHRLGHLAPPGASGRVMLREISEGADRPPSTSVSDGQRDAADRSCVVVGRVDLLAHVVDRLASSASRSEHPASRRPWPRGWNLSLISALRFGRVAARLALPLALGCLSTWLAARRCCLKRHFSRRSPAAPRPSPWSRCSS